MEPRGRNPAGLLRVCRLASINPGGIPIRKLLIDYDRLVNADRTTVARTTVELFDRVQHREKEAQLLGLACAFILMAESLRVPAQDAFTAAANLMADKVNPSGREARFDAMKFHLETELLKEGD